MSQMGSSLNTRHDIRFPVNCIPESRILESVLIRSNRANGPCSLVYYCAIYPVYDFAFLKALL